MQTRVKRCEKQNNNLPRTSIKQQKSKLKLLKGVHRELLSVAFYFLQYALVNTDESCTKYPDFVNLSILSSTTTKSIFGAREKGARTTGLGVDYSAKKTKSQYKCSEG